MGHRRWVCRPVREVVVVLGLEMPQLQMQPSASLLSTVGTRSRRKTLSQACATLSQGFRRRC